MKKALISVVALLALAGGLRAQDYSGNNDPQPLAISPIYTVPSPGDWFYMMPLTDQMSMIYGSRYRKANSNLLWGISLTTLSAPTCALVGLAGLMIGATDDLGMEGYSGGVNPGGAILGTLGLIGTAASLGVGIPLWVKGRKDLDDMMDDYSRRYAPKPNITMGPTQNGVGLALRF
ncbi:MAG: hypothetical protein J5769_03705 [Bacteroidales bacterium]|nr:hypothetical protein [Bacteroidales bacterium]